MNTSRSSLYVSDSLFLAAHPVFESIASLYENLLCHRSNQSIYIVCERKEDLIAVRAQIHQTLLKKELVESDQVIDGMTMLTLDNLTAKIIAALSNSEVGILSQAQIDMLRNPFLTVVDQEQIVKLILIQFGYFDADALPIAKQILALIDVAWPHDESFFQLLCDTQNKSFVKTVFDITEHSLKKILATYQAAQQVLANYNRLQPFVANYLEPDFLNHLQQAAHAPSKQFVFPQHLIESPLVWFSAPEYQTETTLYKPGNYQATLVDAFAETIKKAKQGNSEFIHARAVLNTVSHDDPRHVECVISHNTHQYFQKTIETFERYKNDESLFFLLGDFNPGDFRTVRSDAAGAYQIQKKWLDVFFATRQNSCLKLEIQIDSNVDSVLQSLNSLYDDYSKNKAILTPFQAMLKKIGLDYHLPQIEFNEFDADIFYQSIQSESVLLGESSILTKTDRALSYFAHTSLPTDVVVFGRVHGQTSPSFNVKILNDAIFLLKRRGVVIEHIASDIMYRGFWSWLLSQPQLSIQFLLPNQKSYDDMPETIRNNKLKNLTYDTYKIPPHALNTNLAKVAKNFSRPNWAADFSWRMSSPVTPIVSASQLEDYVECPFRFYLNHLLKFETEAYDSYAPLPLTSGIDAHTIAEKVISRFQLMVLLNENLDLVSVIKRLQDVLNHENLYRSTNASQYVEQLEQFFFDNENVFSESIKIQVRSLFSEIGAVVYGSHLNESDLQRTLRTELLKRIFKRLIDIELFLASLDTKTKPVLCEFSKTLKLGPISVSCRLDRVDVDENHRFHILDYKTSKIVSSLKMTLFPSQRNSGTKLSVQGALYALAFLSHLDESDHQHPTIASFSEIRLRSLNGDAGTSFLRYDFPSPLASSNEASEALKNEYLVFAESLHKGQFSAQPLEKSICLFCEHRKICPTGLGNI